VTDDHSEPAFAIDPRLERLADGSLPVADLTPDELQMRQLILAASGAALPEELVGKEQALAAYASAIAARAASTSGASWVMAERERRSGRRTGAAAIGAVAAVLLSGVAAAAATGTLPAPVQHAVQHAWGGHEAAQAGTSAGLTARTHPSNTSDDESEAPPTGTTTSDSSADDSDPSEASASSSAGHASHVPAAGSVGGSAAGLCRAWTAHHGVVNAHSALARSLGGLAGGSGQIAAYCQTVLAAPHGHSDSPDPSASPSSTGHGQSHGNGKAKGHGSSAAPKAHPSKPGHAKAKPTPSNSSSNNGNGGTKGHQP
jgi:hypothetical protein